MGDVILFILWVLKNLLVLFFFACPLANCYMLWDSLIRRESDFDSTAAPVIQVFFAVAYPPFFFWLALSLFHGIPERFRIQDMWRQGEEHLLPLFVIAVAFACMLFIIFNSHRLKLLALLGTIAATYFLKEFVSWLTSL